MNWVSVLAMVKPILGSGCTVIIKLLFMYIGSMS